MSDRSRRELAERIDELEESIEALRAELEPPRGPMGVPRPPRPRELLRFTDEYAIPAAVATLEANIRALEMLRAGIRASDPERAVEGTGEALADRASGIGRASLERLDRALADVASAVEGSEAPRNSEARDLLEEVRRLDEEIRGMIEGGAARGNAGADRTEAVRIEVRAEGESTEAEPADEGDDPEDTTAEEVEAELEAVKEEVEGTEADGDGADDES